MAYTKENLDRRITHINSVLLKHNKQSNYLKTQKRNGYIGLDLYDANGQCLRTIAIGTASQLQTAALDYGFAELASIFDK